MKRIFAYILLLCFGTHINEAHNGDQCTSSPVSRKDPARLISNYKPEKGLKAEYNKGQWNDKVKFKADLGQGVTVFMERDRFTYSMYDQAGLYRLHEMEKQNKNVEQELIKAHAFQMKFVGAALTEPVGSEPFDFYQNYFIGNDPKFWASEVPVFKKVSYHNLYEGIDLKIYGAGDQLKYDYVVHPGSKAENIRLEFPGADDVSVTENILTISTSVDDLVESIPYAYQIIDGKEIAVKCRYNISGNGKIVSFDFPEGYDPAYILVIDPVVMASTYSGSTANTYGHCATFDSQGNIYTGGRCFGQGYPATTGAFQITFGGNVDIAVSKLNPTGTARLYATYIGGNAADYPHSMFVQGGNLYVLGSSMSPNYPTSTSAFDNTPNGSGDIVISKLDVTGTNLLGSTYIGGSQPDGVNNFSSYNYGDTYRGEVVVNNTGEPYIVSCSSSTNFPVTTGAYDVIQNGGQDAVVFKMSANLSSMVWATYLGGSGHESGCSLRINQLGDVFVVGLTQGQNFPVTTGAYLTTYAGGSYDGYIAKLNSSGTGLTAATFVGSNALDILYFVDLDYNSDVYVYGISTGSMPVSNGVYANPGSQTFMMKLNIGLTGSVYSTVLGNGQHTTFSPSAFMVDLCQNVYMSGWGNTFSYPTTTNAVQAVTDFNDFHLMVLTPNAAGLLYATYYGANGTQEHVDGGTSRFDPNGIVYQGVCECGNSFPTLPGSIATTNSNTACDIVVFKIDFQPNCDPLLTNTTICYGSVATVSLININNLTNATYSIQPGGTISTNPVFTVSPLVNTSYSLYVTGINYLNATVTNSGIASVTVNPQPVLSPTIVQPQCTDPANGFSLGLSFLPPSSSPAYTVSWSALPNGVQSGTQTSATGGINAGVYTASVTTNKGCKAFTTFTINSVPNPLVFSVNGPNKITCIDPSVTLSLTPAANSFTWYGTTGVFSGPTAVFSASNVGTWTVNGISGASGCASSKTFVIVSDLAIPASTVTPLLQNITCSVTAAGTVSAYGNPSVNITHYWLSPFGGTVTAANALSIYSVGAPGTYTHVLVNEVNGCSTTKIFSVTSANGYPTFTLTSPQNFSLGCFTRSVATINITNAQSTPPGAPVSYTLLGPSSSQTYVPGPISSFSNIMEPGLWTAITRDDNSLCETKVMVSVLQNTVAPNNNVVAPLTMLNCDYTTTVLHAASTTQNVSYNWSFPNTPGNQPGDSLRIFIVNPSTSTTIANYTLTVTDNNNTCRSTTVIPMRQNLFQPKALFSGNIPISCKTPTVMLSNVSTSSVPPNLSFTLPVVGYLWSGPSPQVPSQMSSTYLGATPGVYTLVVKDQNNGCFGTYTATVDDFRDYPVVNQPDAPPPFIFDCAANGATIFPIVTSPTTGLTYSWLPVPSTSFSTMSDRVTIVNNIGTYNVIVFNPANGCATSGMVEVILGTLDAKFTADPGEGFAPLTVTFNNLSASSSTANGTQGIKSLWSFGNGKYLSLPTASINPTTIYQGPGIYTVVLFASKGDCKDTAVRIVKVELPSELEIPNVFTPNNDGINDLFFIHATNLTDIEMYISDRWGHKVFEVVSKTGNIAWNGKNQSGVECAEGVYFYVFSAQGTDHANYEQKGTITLVR
jgi:gliding motility-associated-like protein